ncbi:hypothetical protein [Gracilinema caldarium]|uniref:Uncharacterized protein n=1 Tax=Gracilinema caldarium (strain ATCC 51460 / DSM 7334 / H1) TaxID=744872 RepID=F8F3X7_GRAC1|nr:hypothetical protein [Gracilinema caldarium]AEJ20496.1 hypothetical protein Spica_2386 [Gracilinema caldarium DSM 7334]
MMFTSSIITSIPNYDTAWHIGVTSRLAIPVSPSNYIYSHFEHVSGVPAAEDQQGVPITKLKILDALIERLSQMKKEPQGQISVDQIDALIEQYKKEIEQAATAHQILPYNPAPAGTAGTLVNLVA